VTGVSHVRGIHALLGEAVERLHGAGLSTARPDAEWLLGCVLDLDRFGLYIEPARPVTPGNASRFRALVARRAAHEPLQHLLGYEDFHGLRLRVTPDVLVPRPETEALVDWALALMRPWTRPAVADVGTGSGAIACAVAAGHPSVATVAIDISPRALAVAADNAAALGLAGRVRVVAGDLLEPVRAQGMVFDAVIANPPYLPTSVLPTLPAEVARYEPALALDGGRDGMTISRRIIRGAGPVLRPGGWLLMEIGEDQAGSLASAMAAEGFVAIESRRDLCGVERYIGGQWEPGPAALAPAELTTRARRRPGSVGC
jgi:release factor glutamine methyltransferase